VFGTDYEALATRIDEILGERKVPVFVGTVPDVSIPPIAKGLGKVQNNVYPHYVRFFVADKHEEPPLFHKSLSGDQVKVVQDRIEQFNGHIRTVVARRANWHVVETADVLQQLSVRRQGLLHDEPLRNYYLGKKRPDHPLLELSPVPSLLMLQRENGARKVGGLTSLDGVHPSTLGYGIAAEVFLEAMQKEGIAGADPLKVPWKALINQDRLVTGGPAVWDDFLSAAENLSFVWDFLFRQLGSRI
jgi:hypothetical protein